jgi:carbon-monoxide dehydrogenase iron sulfur subunit
VTKTSAEGVRMSRVLRIDEMRCTGCNSCVLTCAFGHEGLFAPARARIRIEKDAIAAVYIPRVCIQCEEAPCVDACPVDALTQSGSGVIDVDRDRCVGCRKCVAACPYGGVLFDEQQGVPLICDLCGGRPACVEICALPQAIQFVERETG